MPDRRGAGAAALTLIALRAFPARLTLLAALAAACTAGPSVPLRAASQSLAADQTLRVRLAAGPRTLDPSLVTDEREEAVVRQFSEALLRPAVDGREVLPAAAESFDLSPDGITWTFRLRSNGRFADGQPVRAQDFVFAWRRLIDPRTAAPHGDLFAGVVSGGEEAQALGPRGDPSLDAALDRLGLRAPDDLTFQVTTPSPMGSLRWIATLPEGGPLRPEMLKAPGQAGNGPFRVADSAAGRVVLVPNPAYWAGRTTLSHLVFDFGPDPGAGHFGAGAVDILAAPPDGLDAGLRASLRMRPELTTFWIAFNTGRAPLDNARVRQAIAEGIDRDALAADLFGGRAAPATTLVPRGIRGHRPEAGRPQESNPGAARQLLDQAGVPRDQLVALPLIVQDRPLDRDIASAVAAQLQRNLGVSVSVQPLRPQEYSKRLQEGDFALAGPGGWTADYPDQQSFLDLFRSVDGHNAAGWRNPRYDGLVRQGDAETNPDRRDQLYGQAEQLLVQEAPVAFLVQRLDAALVKGYVRGLRPTAVDEWPGATYASQIYIAAH